MDTAVGLNKLMQRHRLDCGEIPDRYSGSKCRFTGVFMSFRITLVQQGVWHMRRESMPLAIGYLASCVRHDPELGPQCDVTLKNYDGGKTAFDIAVELLCEPLPEIIGFSVLGWNIQQFASVAGVIKQTSPSTMVVFGGNHVANQGDTVFSRFPQVDVVVNGEGEVTFPELVRRHLASRSLGDVRGISFRRADGTIVTTPPQDRISDLDTIPSPILNGVIPLLKDDGEFRYDVALMETNRGCPYKCSFCYWGGATGQRVRSFSRDRLRAELITLAEAKAETVVLCDANFGMLRQDVEFVEDLLEIRKEYGYPFALETSWAKNKSKIFYEIVGMMAKRGMHSSFTLALQTLTDSALELMNRKNMRINDWLELVKWLSSEGLDCYAELIWGAPGETPNSFFKAYDGLAEHVSRIAAYPLLLLPNTSYWENRKQYGFITVKGIRDDFDYVLANDSADVREHLRMQRFLFWARLLAENLMFRHIWRPLRWIGHLMQSRVIESFGNYIVDSGSQLASSLRSLCELSTADPDSLSPALLACFSEQEFDRVALAWWDSKICPRLPVEWRGPLRELLRYDLDTRPIPHPPSRGVVDYSVVAAEGEKFYEIVRSYGYDLNPLLSGSNDELQQLTPPVPKEWTVRLRYKMRFGEIAASTNHEETAHYVARVAELEPR
jgi:radical SAM C-methyltransferase